MPEIYEQWMASKDSNAPESGSINRRSFVGQLTAGFAAMMTGKVGFARGGLAGRTPDKHGTNGFLRAFPSAKEIPGIRHVDTTLVPNARKAIIVLRQIHWSEGLWNPDRADELQEVIECQTDLYHAIKFLQTDNRTRMKNLFVEGLPEGKKRPSMEHNTLRKRWSPEWNDFLAYYGAEGIRQDESDLVLLGAEDEKLKKYVEREINEKGWGYAARNSAFEPREDAFLDIAHRADFREIYVIYGAGHKWQNNIEKWNSLHPEHRFSLCVLTPTTFALAPLRVRPQQAPASRPSLKWY